MTDATEPHGVAIDARAGKIHWTDWTLHFPTLSTQCEPIDGGAIVDLGVRGASIEVSQVIADPPPGDANGDGGVDYAGIPLPLATVLTHWSP